MKTISKFIVYSLSLCLLFACSSKRSKFIRATSIEYNKQCPARIDFIATLEKVDFKSPKTLRYYYKLDLNQTGTDKGNLKAAIEQNLTYRILNDKELDELKKIGAVFKYIYKDQDGNTLFDITFDPALYNSKEFAEQKVLSSDKVWELLQYSAEALHQQLPQAMNEAISLLEVNAIRPRTLEYVYRYEVEKAKIDTSSIETDQIKRRIISGIIRDNADKVLKDNNVLFRFIYGDKDGVAVRTIEVGPQDYNKNRRKRVAE